MSAKKQIKVRNISPTCLKCHQAASSFQSAYIPRSTPNALHLVPFPIPTMAFKLELKSKVRALTSWFGRCFHFSETGDHDHQHEPLLDTVEAGVTHATQLGIAVGSPAESPGIENDGFPGQAESTSKVKPSRRKALLIGVCNVHTTPELHTEGKEAVVVVPDEPISPMSARSDTLSVSTTEGLFSDFSELEEEEESEEEDLPDPPKLNGPHKDVAATKELLIGTRDFRY